MKPSPCHLTRFPGLTSVYGAYILIIVAQGLEILSSCEGFDWDRHNADKIWQKHRVLPAESEEVFFNRPLVVADDLKHSEQESRYYALGRTDAGRRRFVVFTVRRRLIRVISARDMSRKEREVYPEHEEDPDLSE